jgi:hypothetical protein
MPTKKQCGDIDWVLARLKDVQEAEHDMRQQAREAHEFVTHREGQWEPKWWEQNEGKPRYTFDLVGPIIDQVAGTLEKRDFSINVTPTGGDASEDVAETLSGLIRSIENLSGAGQIYNRATREAITCGWMAGGSSRSTSRGIPLTRICVSRRSTASSIGCGLAPMKNPMPLMRSIAGF